MKYQPRSTNPYIMEKKLNECVGGGGLDPSVLEEIEAEISVLGSENATMAQDIIDIKGSLNSINDNLSGFKFYPTGTEIVGLISDDSAYTDANGKYVIWGTATANQLVADNPDTYKLVPSTEDCRGEVGADTATPFSGNTNYIDYLNDNVWNDNGEDKNVTGFEIGKTYILAIGGIGGNGKSFASYNYFISGGNKIYDKSYERYFHSSYYGGERVCIFKATDTTVKIHVDGNVCYNFIKLA